jgi:hypothetical protein
MLVAIALDKPLADVKELVADPTRLIAEIMQILQDKQAHPVLAQMVNPDVRDDLPISEFATASSASGSHHALYQHFGVYSFICSVELPGSMSFAYAPTCMGVRIVASDSQNIKNFW